MKAVMAAWLHGSPTVRRLRPWLGKRGSAVASRCQGEFDVEENGEEGAAERAPASAAKRRPWRWRRRGKCRLGLTTVKMKTIAGARGHGDRGRVVGG
jgi:hypothetical protein